nr:type III-B CRISPR module-associated protein Cmr5 [Moraxella sp.]
MEAKVEKKPTMAIRSKKYAELAYPLIEKIKGTETEAKYRTLALTFPTMIMQSGLAQAIGFLMAKDEAHHQKMLAHLKTLLNDNNLYSQVLQSDITTYQKLTRDAIEATSWLKRYTQALLDKQS